MDIKMTNLLKYPVRVFVVALTAVFIIGCSEEESTSLDKKNIEHELFQFKPIEPFNNFKSSDYRANAMAEETEIEVEGEENSLIVFGSLERNEYKVKFKDGVTEGTFYWEALDPETEEVLYYASGYVSCVGLSADGKTANMAGVVTDTDLEPVFFAGALREWIGGITLWVAVDDDLNGDFSTDIRTFPAGINTSLPAFHCAIGIPKENFGDIEYLEGKIKVKQD